MPRLRRRAAKGGNVTFPNRIHRTGPALVRRRYPIPDRRGSDRFVFVLNHEEAVRAFSHGGNVKIGADAGAAAGPVGRHAEAEVMPTAAIYTYSRSKGLFAGVSLQGAVIATQTDANRRYYGRDVSAAAILSGKVSPPAGAAPLLSVLGR